MEEASVKIPARPETYTIESGRATKAAEAMARASVGDGAARAEFSRLLVEESKAFGAYVTAKIATDFTPTS